MTETQQKVQQAVAAALQPLVNAGDPLAAVKYDYLTEFPNDVIAVLNGKPPAPEPIPPTGVTDLLVFKYDDVLLKVTLRYTVVGPTPFTVWQKITNSANAWSKTPITDTNGDVIAPVTRGNTYVWKVVDAAGVASNETSPFTVPGATPGGSDEPVPVTGKPPTCLYKTSGQAPWVFHAHALDVLPDADPLATMYEWDFGDPAGLYNQMTGFNAAHLYAKPGAYTITLKVTPSTGAAVTSKISVSVGGPSRAVTVITNPSLSGAEWISDNVEYHLAAGTFDRAKPIKIKGKNVRVYGFGKTTINYTGAKDYSACFNIDGACEDVIISGVNFDSKYSGMTRDDKPVRGIQLDGRNVAVVDCKFNELGDAINAESEPAGVLILNQTCTSKIAGYPIWATGMDWVVLGQVAPDSYVEHTNRLFPVRGNWSYNRIANPGGTANEYKGSWSPREFQYIWFANNVTGLGPLSIGPLAGTQYTSSYCVVYNNDIGDRIEVWPGVTGVAIVKNRQTCKGKSAIYIRKETGRPVKDVRVSFTAISGDSGKASGDTAAIKWGAGNTYNGQPI